MSPGKINVVRLAHVHYQVPNLQRAEIFLKDFGLVEAARDESRIHFRGFGKQPYVYIAEQSPTGKRAFLGAAWVNSVNDLETAALYSNASPINRK
jgi:hypothetical protein